MTPPTMATTAEAGVPAEKKVDDARLMAHTYDGIREYDNPLPGWWRSIFWASIVFAAGYWVWFHVAPWHSTPESRYREELVIYDENREARAAADAKNVSEQSLKEESKNPETVAHGAA